MIVHVSMTDTHTRIPLGTVDVQPGQKITVPIEAFDEVIKNRNDTNLWTLEVKADG